MQKIRLIVSEESATYRPEMEWLAGQIAPGRMSVHGQEFTGFTEGDAVYRFFELFDLPNIPAADELFQRATDQTLTLTAPPKSFLEEKMTFALFHNRNLTEAWRQQLGESFKRTLEGVATADVGDRPFATAAARGLPRAGSHELGAAQGSFAEGSQPDPQDFRVQ